MLAPGAGTGNLPSVSAMLFVRRYFLCCPTGIFLRLVCYMPFIQGISLVLDFGMVSWNHSVMDLGRQHSVTSVGQYGTSTE